MKVRKADSATQNKAIETHSSAEPVRNNTTYYKNNKF